MVRARVPLPLILDSKSPRIDVVFPRCIGISCLLPTFHSHPLRLPLVCRGPFIACSCVSQTASKFPFHFAFVALSPLISPPFRLAVAPVELHQRLLAPFSNTRSTASTQARRLPTMGAQGSKPPKITSHDRAILDLKVARDKIRIYSKKVRAFLSPSGGRCDGWIEDEEQAFCGRQSSLLQ